MGQHLDLKFNQANIITVLEKLVQGQTLYINGDGDAGSYKKNDDYREYFDSAEIYLSISITLTKDGKFLYQQDIKGNGNCFYELTIILNKEGVSDMLAPFINIENKIVHDVLYANVWWIN